MSPRVRPRTNEMWLAYQPAEFSTAAADELAVHPWALTPTLDTWQTEHPDEGIFPIETRREMIAGLVLLGSQLCERGAAAGEQPWSVPIETRWIVTAWPGPSDRAFLDLQRRRLRRAGVLSHVDDDTEFLSEHWFTLLPGLPAVDWAALRAHLGVDARGVRAEAAPAMLVARLMAYEAASRGLASDTTTPAALEIVIEHAQVGAWCGMSRQRVATALGTLESRGLLERHRQHGKAERVRLLGRWWNGGAPPGLMTSSLSDAPAPRSSSRTVNDAIVRAGARSAVIPPELLALVVDGTLVVDLDVATGRLTFRKAP